MTPKLFFSMMICNPFFNHMKKTTTLQSWITYVDYAITFGDCVDQDN